MSGRRRAEDRRAGAEPSGRPVGMRPAAGGADPTGNPVAVRSALADASGAPAEGRIDRRALAREGMGRVLAGAVVVLPPPADATPGRVPCAAGATPAGGVCRLVSPRQRAWLQRRERDRDRERPWFTLLATGPRAASGWD